MSAFTLKGAETALVLIDLQNGIVNLPLAPHPAADIVERSLRLAQAVRAQGGTVVFVRVALGELLHLPVDQPTRAADAPPPPAAASELIDAIQPQAGDVLITKRQWGAFYGTELEQQLLRRGVRTLILGGIATNFGVESTARAAFDRGYHLVFAEDAMTSVNPDAHRFAVGTIFPRMGRVRDTETVIAALKA